MSEAEFTVIPQMFWTQSGLAAARPAAAGLRNGSLWYSTDTKDIDQVQAGAWVTVFDYSALASAMAIHEIGGKHRWTANKLLKGAGAGSDPTEIEASDLEAAPLTVAIFQIYPATGTITSGVANVNNNNTGSYASAYNLGEYAEIMFAATVKITQFRYFGLATENGDGSWKIEYKDTVGTWHDWKTGIPTRVASWSNWDSSGGEKAVTGLRLTATAMDTSDGHNKCGELEVKY